MIRAFLILLASMMLALPVVADTLVARRNGETVRLDTQAPCTSKKVLAHLNPSSHAAYQAASSVMGAQHFEACWVKMSATAVHVMYEDGDQAVIPLGEVKPEYGA